MKGGPSQYNLRKLWNFLSTVLVHTLTKFWNFLSVLHTLTKLWNFLSVLHTLTKLWNFLSTYLDKVVKLIVSFTYLDKVVELSVLDEEVFVEGHWLFVAAAERSIRTLHLLSRLSRKLGRKKPHVISQPISRKRLALTL